MSHSEDDLSVYDYHLPEELIASHPLPERDASRLLLVDRRHGEISHHAISDLPSLLQPQDCLVLNNTRVVPAKLRGRRADTGGRWEGLFLGTIDGGNWKIIGQTRGRLQPGMRILLESQRNPLITANAAADADQGTIYQLTLREKCAEGIWVAEPESAASAVEILQQWGSVPLPPYLKRPQADADDDARYQTVYAERPGAVAAPTAGLHFTPELLERCASRGIRRADVTLHVGLGTFRPISTEKLSQHQMHEEWCELPELAARMIQQSRESGGRTIAVGTTSVRTLETAAADGRLKPWSGETRLFIRPGYVFQAVDILLTNFHLPRSTLFVLVCAFAGIDLMHEAYRQAIEEKYRFFSYGDAMLIV